MAMTLAKLIAKAREQLQAITGLTLGTTVSAREGKDGWHVQVEAIERKSILDTQDILAIYETIVDAQGNFITFTRIGMRRRNDVAALAGSEIEV